MLNNLNINTKINLQCKLCPRECGADRTSNNLGYCKTGIDFNIASICIHRGEEPVISGKNGICNIFFTHCNLQCCYCQNEQISRNNCNNTGYNLSLEKILDSIIKCLDKGCHAVGFVSPSHCVPQVIEIILGIKKLDRNPVFVYNSNGYDKVDTLKMLDGLIDVYIPDFKYIFSELAKAYSDAFDYPDIAKKAISEMFHQKGSTLITNENGEAISGLIIRHLVLPDEIENSIHIINYIADYISPAIHLSLMSQYCPLPQKSFYDNLNRKLTSNEYNIVINEMERLGFYKGWVQELDSSENYAPDFNKDHPFEY